MSPDDVLVILRRKVPSHAVVAKIESRFDDVEGKVSVPAIQRDIKIQYLQAFLIEALIDFASKTFVDNANLIFDRNYDNALTDSSCLCETLKEVAVQNAFSHPTVLRTEAAGAIAIDALLTVLWEAISDRREFEDLRSRRQSPRARYVFSLISPNYIEQAVIAEGSSGPESGMRYRELRLLTDMVSGMTDTFAMTAWKDISTIPHADCA